MKHKGCLLDYTGERNRALMKTFLSHLAKPDISSCARLWEMVAQSPAPRFWVSEERATTIVALMLAGKTVPRMRDNKREMFREICRRVKQMRESRPDHTLPQLVRAVIMQPAPRFYLTPRTIGLMLSRIRGGWYDRQYNRYRITDGHNG